MHFMKSKMSTIGIIILVLVFGLFYGVTVFLLERRVEDNTVNNVIKDEIVENDSFDDEKYIVNSLYSELRILYDVVNSKFKVNQSDTITMGDIVYKKITNFDDVIYSIFTENGKEDYLNDLNEYFAYTENGYYLAGNLVTYQTYYFRGDKTNIYILDASSEEINAIIYEKWSSNNINTLATVKIVNSDNGWLVDNVKILSNE